MPTHRRRHGTPYFSWACPLEHAESWKNLANALSFLIGRGRIRQVELGFSGRLDDVSIYI
jgi:hypothetical protein